MAFCINCGKELPADAKFCSNCGKATNVTVNFSRPYVYDGELHKCPNCGELLHSFTATCPSCGLELRGIKVAYSVTNFVSQLENTKLQDEKVSLIRNYPIPNAKEDIWEFMFLSATNILNDVPSELRKAWYAKFNQCYQKAKIILDEHELQQVTMLYEETSKKYRAFEIAQGTKATGKVIGTVCSGLFYSLGNLSKMIPQILSFLLRNILPILAVLSYLKAIQVDRTLENGVGYELLGGILSIASAYLLKRKGVSLYDILIVGICGGLHFYLAKFLYNGAGLQLFGVITLILVLMAFVHKVKDQNSGR